jgi:glucosamine kinase
MRIAQQALDRRVQAGTLARSVWAECGADRDALQAWCDAAGQNAYGALAPLVFDAEPHDPAAAQLLARAAQAIETLALAIDPQARLPLAITGGVGRRLAPRLSPAMQSRLVEAAEAPARGALRLLRTAEVPA